MLPLEFLNLWEFLKVDSKLHELKQQNSKHSDEKIG